MSPTVRYTLGRFGVFAAVLALLLPVQMNILVKVMIAVVAAAGFSWILLAKWRVEAAESWEAGRQRRRAERDRLRAALAGDEDAAAEGDRAKPDPEQG